MQHEYQITLVKEVNMWHKTRIQLSLIINVGISIISCPPILNIKKIYQPWPSRTLGATAGYGMNSHRTPGSLFAMGWSRSPSKDFFRFIKSDEKKNYLLMASILFYFLIIHPRSSPTRSHFSSPLRSPLVARPFVYLFRRAHVFLVGCCVYLRRLSAV